MKKLETRRPEKKGHEAWILNWLFEKKIVLFGWWKPLRATAPEGSYPRKTNCGESEVVLDLETSLHGWPDLVTNLHGHPSSTL